MFRVHLLLNSRFSFVACSICFLFRLLFRFCFLIRENTNYNEIRKFECDWNWMLFFISKFSISHQLNLVCNCCQLLESWATILDSVNFCFVLICFWTLALLHVESILCSDNCSILLFSDIVNITRKLGSLNVIGIKCCFFPLSF